MINNLALSNEPFLEKWARFFRYKQSDQYLKPYLKNKGKVKLLDVGCGQDILFLKYLQKTFPFLSKKINYYGLDPLVKNKKILKQAKIINYKYENLKFKKPYFDIITMFAVLEHVDDPAQMIADMLVLLKKNGVLLLTTPSRLSKPVLEFLSFQLNLISPREIAEHQNYFAKKSLLSLCDVSLKNGHGVKHSYFEFGLNNLLLIKKRSL